jgi:hypothetical protein
MVQMLDESTFYVLGRSAAKFEERRTELESLNTSNKIVFIQTEVSLVSGVDDACKQIAEKEKRVYFYMSAGKVPFEGASCMLTIHGGHTDMIEDTKEGIELSFALSYYNCIRIVNNLLPLLQRSSHPRILSVLNSGRKKALIEDDLELERSWAPRAMIN